MKIGILCGTARSAQRKASLFSNAIERVGHTPQIFSRGPLYFPDSTALYSNNIERLVELGSQSNCDFFIGCNDNLGNAISILNSLLDYETIPLNAVHKSYLGSLSPKLDGIPSWRTIEDVPKNMPIIVKSVYGSGSKGGDPWAYETYNSIDDFTNYLMRDVDEGLARFYYAQKNPGTLGTYIFQQYIESDHSIYHHYLNDGTSRHWMETKCMIPRATSKTYFKITDVDNYDFAHNLTFGTLGSFQAFPTKANPLIFDFNVRSSAYWNILHEYICPNFFDAYFDRLLNKSEQRYNWQCDEFVMEPEQSESSGLRIQIEDFPTSGTNGFYNITMK